MMKKRILTLMTLCAALILLTTGAWAEEAGVRTIHAENADALMEALRSGASDLVITLDAKDYVIYSTGTYSSGEPYRYGFTTSNLNNVTIRGQAGTRILTPYDCGGSAVLTIYSSKNVTLDTLSMGHQDSWCEAPVLILNYSTGVEILNCDLWGCGYYGIGAGGGSFHAENTVIRDCSGYIMDLGNCSATFDNCFFLRNGQDSRTESSIPRLTAALQNSPMQVVFNSCEFRENDCVFKIAAGQEGKYEFNNCTETNNTWQNGSSEVVAELTGTATLTLNVVSGQAVISGTGAVGFLPYTVTPYISSVEVKSGITDIGSTFSGNSTITEIVLPDTLEKIEGRAFYSCSKLAAIDIPEGVTSIGENAFRECKALTEISIPNSVANIGDYAFYDCTSLTRADIPGGVTSIGDYMFSGCAALTEVNIPSSVETIGSYAFSDCAALTGVNIPSSVETIGSCAFSGCAALTGVSIPSSVETIAESVFSGCTALAEADIPGSVKTIDDRAFYGCTALTAAIIPNGTETIENLAFYECSNLREIVIPESIVSISSNAFGSCNALERVTMPVNMINSYSFYGHENVSRVAITGQGELTSSYYSAWKYTKVPCTVEIRDGVTAISGDVFYNCTMLTSVTIPGSVKTIGQNAFSSCTGLTSVTIQNGVETIGSRAFFNCTSLRAITIPGSVETIGSHAFFGCADLASVTIPNGVETIDQYVFSGCTGLTGITIPSSVGTIGQNAFSGCTGLTGITIPGSVGTIGQNAFSGCTGLAGITIPGSVGTLGQSAFSGCTGLTEIVISDSLTEIGKGAFENCTGLKSVTWPAAYNQNLNRASNIFTGCTGVTYVKITGTGPMPDIPSEYNSGMPWRTTEAPVTVEIAEGITSIGNFTFNSCSSLAEIIIPETVTRIGSVAFSGCSKLSEAIIPDSVTEIAPGSFNYCTGLQSVSLPVTAANISAFSGCTGVTYVKITGTGAIPDVSTATIYTPWRTTEMPVVVELGRGITGIGEKTFYGCSHLAGISIPDTVTYIGKEAFRQSSLPQIEIPSNVESIGQYAFADCDNLTQVKISSGVKSIEPYTFSRCKNLTLVKILSGVESIGQYAFANCDNLTQIKIPSGVKQLADNAFNSCTRLTWVEIPSSVEILSGNAFVQTRSLTDVYYTGTEEQWRSIAGNGYFTSSQPQIHYETTESAYISSAIEAALSGAPDLASVKTSLGELNADSLSAVMLEGGFMERLKTIEQTDGKTVEVQADSAADLAFPAANTSITGALVNFPNEEKVRLVLGASSDSARLPTTAPASDRTLGFSASLQDGSGKTLSAASLSVPVAVTIELPNEDIKWDSVCVWHCGSGASSAEKINHLSVSEEDRSLTFITSGFSDFIVTYNAYAPFSASLRVNNAEVRVVDERNTLASCATVYAARYEDGRLADVVAGTLSGNLVKFSRPLTADYVLFFLDNQNAPVQSKTAFPANTETDI